MEDQKGDIFPFSAYRNMGSFSGGGGVGRKATKKWKEGTYIYSALYKRRRRLCGCVQLKAAVITVPPPPPSSCPWWYGGSKGNNSVVVAVVVHIWEKKSLLRVTENKEFFPLFFTFFGEQTQQLWCTTKSIPISILLFHISTDLLLQENLYLLYYKGMGSKNT